MLFCNEKIDELGINDLKIIQSDDGFKFGTDAVALAKFAAIKNNARVLDLCTGGGIVPLLLTGLKNPASVTGIEYFKEIADRACRSVRINHLEQKINIINDDVNNIRNYIQGHSFDHITVNPPYKILGSGLENENYLKKAARHEILISLNEVVECGVYALKYGGRFTMVNRIDRLSDVFYSFKINKIEPKRLAFVSEDMNSIPPKIFLVEGIYGGKSGMTVEPFSMKKEV